jgi:imidazolonepropionase-like amidohydrolase
MIVTVSEGTVLDTATMELVDNQTVVIEGDRIVDVVDGRSNVDADMDIDASGQFVMPGFVDGHFHHWIVTMDFARLTKMSAVERGIMMGNLAEGTVRRGFTTIRDAGGDNRGLMRAIDSGVCQGPRIVQAGRILSQTGGHGDFRAGDAPVAECGCQIFHDHAGFVVDGVEACRKAARQALRDGSEFIKIMTSGGVSSPTDPFDSVQFTAEEIQAITVESDHRHTYTTSHAYLPESIQLAINNGVKCIEHGNGLDAVTAARMAELGAIMVPTLIAYRALTEIGPKVGFPESMLAKNDGVFEMGQNSIEIAKSAGVELGFGTDLLGEGHHLQNEEFAIRAELEPAADVLRSMYVTNVKLCKLEGQVGTVSRGAFADLLVSRVNPLEDLAALAEPDANLSTIIQHGQPIR